MHPALPIMLPAFPNMQPGTPSMQPGPLPSIQPALLPHSRLLRHLQASRDDNLSRDDLRNARKVVAKETWMYDEDPLLSIEMWVELHQDCVLYYQPQELYECLFPGCERPASQGPVGGTHVIHLLF